VAVQVTVREALAELTGALGDAVAARWVLSAAWGMAASALATPVTSGDGPVTVAVLETARTMARRRAAGEPLQYVLGSWSFRTLEVAVDRRALVPRPETEQVVEFALDELYRLHGRARPLVVVDLGTGSGVIALSLAAEGHGPLEVWATDVSPDALALARANLELLGGRNPDAAARVRLARGSWFAALPPRLAGLVHLVVANPPYVSVAEWEQLDPVVRDHEPRHALVAGRSGLEALAHLVDQAPGWLAPGGALVAELAPHQADAVLDVARRRGYATAEVCRDLSGRPRALVARLGQ
jgi:release factor glutamine methyltransferase